MLKLSLVIKAIDQATAPIKKITAASKSLVGTGLKQITREGGLAGRALDRVSAIAARVPAPMGRAAAAVRRLAGRTGMGALNLAAHTTGFAIGKTIRLTGKLLGMGAQMATWGLGAAAAGTGAFIGSIIPLASKFEQFQVVLENTEGSADKARRAMAWVKDFAKTTPYEVEEVMEAFVALKAYGIDPTNGSLAALGNMASGMSKGLMQAVEMMADAQTGEFERLKEFGIRAKVAGDRVTLSYTKNGKAMTRIARNTASEISNAVTQIANDRFSGMMGRQSRTLSGLWSNIKDMVAGFQLDIAGAGFFDFVKGQLQALLDTINRLAKDGTLKRWAEETSKWLVEFGTKAIKFLAETDWRAVGQEIRETAQAIRTVAGAIATVVGWINKLAALEGWEKRYLPSWLGGTRSAPAPISTPIQPGAAFGMQGRGPLKAGAPRSAMPAAGWPRSGVMQNKLSLQISTDPGVKARVTEMKPARGTTIDISRGRVAMG